MISRNFVLPIRKTAATATLTLGTFATSLMPSSATAELAPGWEALPTETVFAFRMPNTQAVLEEFRANTVAGQRIFTAEKLDQILQLVEQENQADWQEMVDGLAEYGFTLNDLTTIAQNNWGMGLVAQPRDGEQLPRFVMLTWADMNEDDIDRIYAALDKAEEEIDDDSPNRRVDFELAGFDVRQYSTPEQGPDREVDWELPDDFHTMTAEQQEAHWAQVQLQSNQIEYVTVDETHLLLTRMPGRIAMAIAFPQSEDRVRELIAAGGEIDWDVATDAATAHNVFGAYLSSMEGGAEDAFATRMLAEPEAAAAVARDRSLFELYADGQALLDLFENTLAIEEGPDDAEQFRIVMDALGFDGLGVIAGSGYLADGAFRMDLFSQMETPRAGLLGSLDGQTLPAAPPAWVPAGMTYAHLAYDLSKLYDVILQAAQQIAGPEVMQQVQLGNLMVQGQLQADIPTVLRSLGVQHSVLVGENQEITIESEEYDFETETFQTTETTTTMQSTAIVWELGDPAIWDRVMATAKGFAAGAGDAVQLVDEQGFTGMRMENNGLPMGLMLGQGKLVLSIGPDMLTRTLATINTPPAGEASLLGSTLYQEGSILIDYQDGIGFAIQNAGTGLVDLKKQIVSLLEEESGYEPTLIEQIKALLPTDQDIRAAFGVTVYQAFMTDSGLVYQGAAALPAE